MPKLSKEDKEVLKLEKEKKFEAVKLANDKIFNLLMLEDELSWKDLMFGLIESESMNPWDIDVSIIANKFLEVLKKLKELDFRVSGKMVLAAAVLLKMKSDILIDQDIPNFDNTMNGIEENLPDDAVIQVVNGEKISIYPRSPQPRKRKVSVYDLVNALEKALEVQSRRKKVIPKKISEIRIPQKKFDIGKSMHNVFSKVETHYKSRKNKNKTLTFEELVMSQEKEDKVLTFIPLLHLETSRKVDMDQEKHFETINIKLAKKDEK